MRECVMQDIPYLIFSLHGARYAVEAQIVREVFCLPELTATEEAPWYIVGMLNLRGKIVPVMDLGARLGHPPQPYHLKHSVIVLEQADLPDGQTGSLLGIIANEIHDVRSIAQDEIEAAPLYGPKENNRARVVTSMAKVDNSILRLLHWEHLMQHAEEIREVDPEAAVSCTEGSWCVGETPQEHVILRERARDLMRPIEGHDFAGLMPLAVIGLGGEYFGVDLHAVREFCTIRDVTPVPCCPAHIIGDMNVRGDILTVVDIRGVLQLPIAGAENPDTVMVVHCTTLLFGVLVEEVFDVVYLRPTDMSTIPAAVKSVSEEYLKGTALFREKMLSVIDVQQILTNGSLIVDESI